MAIVVETISVLSKDVVSRQAVAPTYLTGSFVDNDADDHQWKVDGRGKGRLTVAVDNPADNTMTINVYGMHAAGGAVGDVGTFLISSFTVTAAQDKNYQTVNDPFPWYLIQVTPTGADVLDPTVTVYVDFSAY